MGLIAGNRSGDEPQYVVCKQFLVLRQVPLFPSEVTKLNFNNDSSYGNCFKILKQHEIHKSLLCLSYSWLDTTVIYACFHEKFGFQHEYVTCV